jgi:hypothetical protein
MSSFSNSLVKNLLFKSKVIEKFALCGSRTDRNTLTHLICRGNDYPATGNCNSDTVCTLFCQLAIFVQNNLDCLFSKNFLLFEYY